MILDISSLEAISSFNLAFENGETATLSNVFVSVSRVRKVLIFIFQRRQGCHEKFVKTKDKQYPTLYGLGGRIQKPVKSK